MSSTHRTQPGDTFEKIARRFYGSEVETITIERANPGVSEPLTSGVDIAVPTLPDLPLDKAQSSVADNLDEVAVLIDGVRFRFWDRVRVIRALDTMDVVEFGAPWEVDVPGMKEAFRPFQYSDIDVSVGGTVLFTGTAVSIVPVQESSQRVITVSGYSKPGVLQDCTAPASSFPIEFNDQGLREIAQTLCKPFGIGVDFRTDQEDVFDRVALEAEEKVFDFLVKLAKQQDTIIASTSDGKLLFWRGVETGEPVARLVQGFSPLVSVTPFFSPQDYYSSITGIRSVLIGSEGTQATVPNSRLLGVIRPITFSAGDVTEAGLTKAVAARAGRMFGNMASYTVVVDTWRDSSGELWEPNTIISVEASGAMIYKEYKFVIRTVEFNRTSREETASLNLVIPGSFNGKVPETLPWDL